MGKIRGKYAAPYTVAKWKELCEKYENGAMKNKSRFLRENGLPINKRQSLIAWLKKYKEGKLDLAPENAMRIKEGKYSEVERKLSEYIDARFCNKAVKFTLIFCHQINKKQINFTC